MSTTMDCLHSCDPLVYRRVEVLGRMMGKGEGVRAEDTAMLVDVDDRVELIGCSSAALLSLKPSVPKSLDQHLPTNGNIYSTYRPDRPEDTTFSNPAYKPWPCSDAASPAWPPLRLVSGFERRMDFRRPCAVQDWRS